MRRLPLIAILLLCAGAMCCALSLGSVAPPHFKSAYAQLTLTGAGAGAPGGGGGCSQATALLARMDGSQNSAAVTAAICGMVTDGVLAKLNAIHVEAINSTANAVLNWISTSYGLTPHGSCTFTASAGYTGDASTCYIDTGFNPYSASGNWTQNSVTFGGCNLASASYNVLMGIYGSAPGDSTSVIDIADLGYTYNDWIVDSYGAPTTAYTSSVGSFIAVRNSSTNVGAYYNGSLLSNLTDSSANVTNGNLYLLAEENGGSADSFSNHQIAYDIIGGALTGTDVTNIYNRLHTYLSTISAPGGC